MEDDNEIKLDRVLKAEQLSEGNVYLKQAILELWNENITSFEFGPKKGEVGHVVYFNFSITNDNLKFLYKLFDNSFKFKDFDNFTNKGIQVSLYNQGRRFFMNVSVLPKYKNVLYGLILESINDFRVLKEEILENQKLEKYINDVVVCGLHLMDIYSKKNTAVKVSATGKKMFVGIGTLPQDFICNDICPVLSNELEAIKANNGEVAHGTYKCDRDSLVYLTNIVFQASKNKQKSKSN